MRLDDIRKAVCYRCKKEKFKSFFPQYRARYKNLQICFECLKNYKCTTCKIDKNFKEFLPKGKLEKAKTQCWDCYYLRRNRNQKHNYHKKKSQGTLRSRYKRKTETWKILWEKIAIKKNRKDNSRDTKVSISREEFKKWFSKNYKKKCSYCGVEEDKFKNSKFIKSKRDNIYDFSIDRIDSTKGYELNNITISCIVCNETKGFFFDQQEMVKIGKKYIRKLYN